MTVIELFDISPLQNLSAALYYRADKIVFFGSNIKQFEKSEIVYRYILNRHGINADLQYINILKYNMEYAVNRICEIIKGDSNTVIDVAGGSDYILAAAGIAFERCKNAGLRLQHKSIRSGKLVCFGEVPDISQNNLSITLSCDDIIKLHGGKIVYETEKRSGTAKWNLDDDGFYADVMKIWKLCKNDNREWNRKCSRLGELENFVYKNDIMEKEVPRLDISISKEYATTKNKSELINGLKNHLDSLASAGLIEDYKNSSERLSFVYKNEQVRQCLLKAGNALELITYIAAKNAKNKKGISVYNDALMGAVLDWDGKIHSGIDSVCDITNEIDGMLVRGMIPVFISCKNGSVDENELYKLFTVADRFGIKYAKKVLIATDLQKSYNSLKSFTTRAREMGITIIDGVHRMTFSELSKKLASL